MMDAKEFLEIVNKECIVENCNFCSFNVNGLCSWRSGKFETLEIAIEIAEQIKEAKKMTYKKDFLSKFPNALLKDSGTPKTCRGYAYGEKDCEDCAMECETCWNQEYEGGGKENDK